jgi:hypothetical protein
MTTETSGVGSSLNVFFSDPVLINQFIYERWLSGLSAENTAKELRQKQMYNNNNAGDERYFYLIQNETVYQYRIFDQIVKLLADPRLFMAQGSSCEVQIAPSVRKKLIEKFFSFDQDIFRELFGKKLTNKLRKDLDDVSEKTGIGMSSCRRQYDNLHTIQKFFKSNFMLPQPTTITDLIQTTFLLPRKLARRYGVTVFLCHHRFDVNKRALRDFNFATFYYFGKRMIKYWTGPADHVQSEPTVIAPPQDPDTSPSSASTGGGSGSFVVHTTNNLLTINLNFYILRDMKTFLYSNKSRLAEYSQSVMKTMTCTLRQDKLTRLEERFPTLFKNLLVVGSGLVQPKELRDFFIDILEKFVDVCRQVPLNEEEMKLFCNTLTNSFQEIPSLKVNQRNKFTMTWSTFMAVVRDVSALFIKFSE